jgi:hypothetical protein
MGWLFGGSTGGERAADTRAWESQQNREHQAKMGDVNWKRKQVADFNARNHLHKKAVFETEQRVARRENRPPRLWSPEQVPDLPLPPELRPPAPKVREPWRFEGFTAYDLKFFKWMGVIVLLYAPFGITLQIVGGMPGIISIPVMGAVLLTEVWLVLRYLAKGNAEKLARAEKFNPVNVTKKSTAWVKAKTASQQGNQATPVQFSRRQDYAPDQDA